VSFEEQLDSAPQLASLRAQARGDRGTGTVPLSGTAAGITSVQHKLGVVPGRVRITQTNTLAVATTLAVTGRSATAITITASCSGLSGTDPTFEWEAVA
jgi:hypothetical protein